MVFLKTGRFGPYVQLGENGESEKPKRASIPKGTDPEDVDLEMAMNFSSLPREVGSPSGDRQADRGGIWPLRPLHRA